ncbi:hypothetical protein [Salinimicrobium sp. GXAS 041]|uniref:hypothetical protein n=1 Tax=Salinimicrobium sp. GXAS 041 TaxID=3400806 RepID=UPI003C72E1BC
MKTMKLKILMLFLLSGTVVAIAQTEKLEKTYKTNADVTLEVDASHTNVVIENWDRNEVQIEAFLESGQSDKETTKALLANWKVQTSGNAGKVSITSGGGGGLSMPPIDIAALNGSMAKLPEIIDPVMEMVGPLLESISNNPLPPEFYENMSELHFDYEAYQKGGEKYMEEWEKKIEKKFGKEFEVSMEKWASNFEKDTVLWKKNIEVEMEKWGEDFGKSMEAWGESFGKEMEKWAEQVEMEVEAKYDDGGNRVIVLNDKMSKAKKTIRVKVPANARLNLEVRHGEVKLSGKNSNVKANLSHSRFSANTITGKQTNISAAYTPVTVKTWEFGELKTSYVQSCDLGTVRSLKITSNSSDVKIGEILEIGIISGTFGELRIDKVSPNFNTLDITLENSDLILDLPEVALNFSYTGSQSEIDYPASIKARPVKNYDTQTINGYQKSRDGKGSVSIKARYSDVHIK